MDVAKQMSYTDSAGVDHPESVWAPLFLAIDYLSRTARFVFVGFHDLETMGSFLATGRPGPVPGAVKEYVVPSDLFMATVGPFVNPVSQGIYDYAATVKDTTTEGGGAATDFFHAATDVDFPGPPPASKSPARRAKRA